MKLRHLILLGLLGIGFILRLYKITNPIADWHSWRQADTSAVTRNFVKYGVNVLYPRFDDMSDVSGHGANPEGYRFVEFPLFNLLHYSLYIIGHTWGNLEYWGRMTTIIISLISAVLLFKVVERKLNWQTGLVTSGVFLLLPYNIYYSRVILPDPLMITLSLAALLAFDYKNKILTVLFGAGALLVKPTAIFLLLPIIGEFWWYIPMVIPLLFWRWWESHFPMGIPASVWLLNGNGIRFKGAFFRWIFGERIGSLILGKWGLVFLGEGLLGAKKFALWLVGALIYLFTFATGNVQHDYYQIPLIPIVSILVGVGVVQFWRSLTGKLIVMVVLPLMLALSWYDIRGYYQVNHWEIVRAGQAVDRLTPADAIVVAPYQGDTAFLYQTNRRGFPVLTESIEGLKQKFGVSYYVSVNYDDQTNRIMGNYTVIEKTPEYVVVKL